MIKLRSALHGRVLDPGRDGQNQARDHDLSLSLLYSFVVLAYVTEPRLDTVVSRWTVPGSFKLAPAHSTCGRFCIAAPVGSARAVICGPVIQT